MIIVTIVLQRTDLTFRFPSCAYFSAVPDNVQVETIIGVLINDFFENNMRFLS